MSSDGPGKTGRPTVRTPEMIATIERALENGMGYKWAAQLAGVTDRTLREWRRADPDLSSALASADARGAKAAWFCIAGAANAGDWKAAAFMVDHKYSAPPEPDEEAIDTLARRLQQIAREMDDSIPDAPEPTS